MNATYASCQDGFKPEGLQINDFYSSPSLPDFSAGTVRLNERLLRSVELAGPAGRLEALLNPGTPGARFAALVCHPHPRYGGTLHNKVVYHAMKALNDPLWGLGWPVLRFNFRGTGLSQGVHDGKAEAGDVWAALDWLESEFKLPLVVAGFSFGAAMALWACCGPERTGKDVRALDVRASDVRASDVRALDVRAVIALGLPVAAGDRAYHYRFLENATVPKLFVSGDRDEFAPAVQLAQIVGSAAEPKRLVLIPGADHFFTRQLDPMQHALAGWLKEQLL